MIHHLRKSSNLPLMDVYGQALKAYSEEKETGDLLLHTSYGEIEEMPLWYFFREYEEMPDMEKMALSICEGSVLDIGAGTGAHAICLQQMGHELTAIDTSKWAVEIMIASGVKKAVVQDFFTYAGQKYDTLLALMNGIGFIGKLESLESFLKKADELLVPGGQLIIDSSDISYLYEGKKKPQNTYYGEVQFQYEYQGQKGDWFNWLYVDMDTLTERAHALGWYTYILHTENDQYLARLIRR